MKISGSFSRVIAMLAFSLLLTLIASSFVAAGGGPCERSMCNSHCSRQNELTCGDPFCVTIDCSCSCLWTGTYCQSSTATPVTTQYSCDGETSIVRGCADGSHPDGGGWETPLYCPNNRKFCIENMKRCSGVFHLLDKTPWLHGNYPDPVTVSTSCTYDIETIGEFSCAGVTSGYKPKTSGSWTDVVLSQQGNTWSSTPTNIDMDYYDVRFGASFERNEVTVNYGEQSDFSLCRPEDVYSVHPVGPMIPGNDATYPVGPMISRFSGIVDGWCLNYEPLASPSCRVYYKRAGTGNFIRVEGVPTGGGYTDVQRYPTSLPREPGGIETTLVPFSASLGNLLAGDYNVYYECNYGSQSFYWPMGGPNNPWVFHVGIPIAGSVTLNMLPDEEYGPFSASAEAVFTGMPQGNYIADFYCGDSQEPNYTKTFNVPSNGAQVIVYPDGDCWYPVVQQNTHYDAFVTVESHGEVSDNARVNDLAGSVRLTGASPRSGNQPYTLQFETECRNQDNYRLSDCTCNAFYKVSEEQGGGSFYAPLEELSFAEPPSPQEWTVVALPYVAGMKKYVSSPPTTLQKNVYYDVYYRCQRNDNGITRVGTLPASTFHTIDTDTKVTLSTSDPTTGKGPFSVQFTATVANPVRNYATFYCSEGSAGVEVTLSPTPPYRATYTCNYPLVTQPFYANAKATTPIGDQVPPQVVNSNRIRITDYPQYWLQLWGMNPFGGSSHESPLNFVTNCKIHNWDDWQQQQQEVELAPEPELSFEDPQPIHCACTAFYRKFGDIVTKLVPLNFLRDYYFESNPETADNGYYYVDYSCSYQAYGASSGQSTFDVGMGPGVRIWATPASGIGEFTSTVTAEFFNADSAPQNVWMSCDLGLSQLVTPQPSGSHKYRASIECDYPQVPATTYYNPSVSGTVEGRQLSARTTVTDNTLVDSCNPPAPSGDVEWLVPQGTQQVCVDRVIVMPPGVSRVQVYGKLDFYNVTLNLTPSDISNSDGSGVFVHEGGQFIVRNHMTDAGRSSPSVIQSGVYDKTLGLRYPYYFQVTGSPIRGAQDVTLLEVRNSIVRDVGTEQAAILNIRNQIGLYVEKANLVIENSNIQNTWNGLVLESVYSANVKNNVFDTTGSNGFYRKGISLKYGEFNHFEGNTIKVAANKDAKGIVFVETKHNLVRDSVFTSQIEQFIDADSDAVSWNNTFLNTTSSGAFLGTEYQETKSNITLAWFVRVHVTNGGIPVQDASVTMTPANLQTGFGGTDLDAAGKNQLNFEGGSVVTPVPPGAPAFHGWVTNAKTNSNGYTEYYETIQYDENKQGDNEGYYNGADGYEFKACNAVGNCKTVYEIVNQPQEGTSQTIEIDLGGAGGLCNVQNNPALPSVGKPMELWGTGFPPGLCSTATLDCGNGQIFYGVIVGDTSEGETQKKICTYTEAKGYTATVTGETGGAGCNLVTCWKTITVVASSTTTVELVADPDSAPQPPLTSTLTATFQNKPSGTYYARVWCDNSNDVYDDILIPDVTGIPQVMKQCTYAAVGSFTARVELLDSSHQKYLPEVADETTITVGSPQGTTYPSDVSFLSASCPVGLVFTSEASVTGYLVVKGQGICPESQQPIPGEEWSVYLTRPAPQGQQPSEELLAIQPSCAGAGKNVFTLSQLDAEGPYNVRIVAHTNVLPPEQRVGDLTSSCNFRVLKQAPNKFPETHLALVILAAIGVFAYLAHYNKKKGKR